MFGNAFQLYQQAQQFFIEHLTIAGRVEGFYRVDTPKYPPDAFREALVNALCHRDYAEASGSIDIAIYDDRLEVVSTGGLHFGLTVEQLKGAHQSRPWNPLVAQAFYMRGIIEKWGRGTNRMVEQTLEAGLSEPEMIDSRLAFTVRFVAAHSVSEKPLTPEPSSVQEEILAILGQVGEASLRDIVARLEPTHTRRQVRHGLERLQLEGLVLRSGATTNSRWHMTRDRPH